MNKEKEAESSLKISQDILSPCDQDSADAVLFFHYGKQGTRRALTIEEPISDKMQGWFCLNTVNKEEKAELVISLYELSRETKISIVRKLLVLIAEGKLTGCRKTKVKSVLNCNYADDSDDEVFIKGGFHFRGETEISGLCPREKAIIREYLWNKEPFRPPEKQILCVISLTCLLSEELQRSNSVKAVFCIMQSQMETPV